ncbi:nucleoid-associated protein [Xenorhabdus hominickii]|uniref:Nucleoid-associated bacterial family protein n=1 Tax=Xenorhabdus hominickii TaxID=351679 RepID=A0A2G0Q1H1_XENHO|nr:nucleoid-associated protein [Xenorhabdus hominickii]AOM40419.1 nucleoid-associated bacterial family protein [Xenorhabdus hominickii]PHM53063.1 nucleoid-associated bacterial family protein [Xenorhabdus hominickii]
MASPIIKYVIVHELIKEAKKDFDFSHPYNLRRSTLDKTNPTVEKLIKEISDLYGTKGNSAHYGVFKSEQDEEFIPSKFDDYYRSEDCTAELFVSLSHEVMREFVKRAKEEPWSSGGFIVFCDYFVNDCRFFLISMIKKKDGVTISPALEPEDMIHLDLTKINQAARINFSLYEKYKNADEIQKTDLSYLSFVCKGNGQSASAYFIAAIGCDKGMASARATTKLPSEVKKFFLSKTELKEHASKFRQQVIEYLDEQSKSEKSAKLSDIESIATSHMTYIDSEARKDLISELMKHLNSEEIRIPVEFVVSQKSLKKIKNVIYKGSDLSFNFEKSLLGSTADDDVWYNEDTGILAFTNLPAEFRTKISKNLK